MHKETGGDASRAKRAPQLSVIICTYNRCNLVLATLASLRRQTLARRLFEVIVVDNGSADGTLEALQRYLQARGPEEQDWEVRCLAEPRNGLAYARSTGLAAARGEIAVFIDDDALATPRWLEMLLQAYVETGADAVGGRIDLHWEAPRPYWLVDELLPVLGAFAPAPERRRLVAPLSFGSSNFSVKVAALRAVGGFSPLLDKRLGTPTRLGVEDLCRRLHEAGYALWYEPRALVAHRAHAARLCRAFFIGYAYWRGRSEILCELSAALARTEEERQEQVAWRGLPAELHRLARLSLDRTLQGLLLGGGAAGRLRLAMEQARLWGRLRQRLSLIWKPLPQERVPAVLLVMGPQRDAATLLLAQALRREGLSCIVERARLPLAWIWRYRSPGETPRAILQLRQPGAWCLPLGRGLQLLARLWLARALGLAVIVTAAGGWWEGARGPQAFLRRWLEGQFLRLADAILAPSRQTEGLYVDPRLQERVHGLPCAGFYGYYAPPLPRPEAYRRLGIPATAPYVYLCFTDLHSEQEVLALCEAFRRLWEQLTPVPGNAAQGPQLVLAGRPADRRRSARLLQLAARLPALHLFLNAPAEEDIALYLGAADALVLPQLAAQRSSEVEAAMLALSYGRTVVVPDLPAFADLPVPQEVIRYCLNDPQDLERALLEAYNRRDARATAPLAPLEAVAGWREYARLLLKLYERLTASSPSR
jgi:glycosyltransferase involved in cell wall biosynthesis